MLINFFLGHFDNFVFIEIRFILESLSVDIISYEYKLQFFNHVLKCKVHEEKIAITKQLINLRKVNYDSVEIENAFKILGHKVIVNAGNKEVENHENYH